MCVSYPQDRTVTKTIIEKCCKENTNLVFVSKNDLEEISSNCDESVFRYKDRTYTIKLIGEHQLLNAATAIEVIDNSGIKVKEKSIVKGLKNTVWKGRMTKVSEKPLIYVDGAHNEQAWKILKNTVNKYFTNSNSYIVNSNWEY